MSEARKDEGRRETVGLVLAGGAGRRFGGPKGEHVYRGRTLARRAADLLAPRVDTVRIGVAPGAASPAPPYATLADAPPAGRGPLAGLHAAWSVFPGAALLVLACDYPFVPGDLLDEIVAVGARGSVDVALPRGADGRLHPLVARWNPRMAPLVAGALTAGRLRVLDLVEDARCAIVDAAHHGVDALRNVNRRSEWPGTDG